MNKKQLKQIPAEINYQSFEVVENFRKNSGLSKIIFLGGALVDNKLKKSKSVDDYDMMLIGEENREQFNGVEEKLKEHGYEKVGGHEETTTNLAMRQFVDKEGRKFELCLKKDTCGLNSFGTFDIDNLSATIYEDGKIELNQAEAINSLRKRSIKLIEHTKDLFRIIGRMLVHIAKYDIKEFTSLEQNHFRLSEDTKENDKFINEFTEYPIQSKAECLAKFFVMLSRVDNIKDYVEKIAKYKLLDNYFPEVCKVLNDNNFKNFLAKESEKSENKRELNTDLDVFNKMYLYSGNKKEFLNECRILKKARSTKQSKILSEIKKKEFCIGYSIL